MNQSGKFNSAGKRIFKWKIPLVKKKRLGHRIALIAWHTLHGGTEMSSPPSSALMFLEFCLTEGQTLNRFIKKNTKYQCHLIASKIVQINGKY